MTTYKCPKCRAVTGFRERFAVWLSIDSNGMVVPQDLRLEEQKRDFESMWQCMCHHCGTRGSVQAFTGQLPEDQP